MNYANPSRFGPTIQERSLAEDGRQFDSGQKMNAFMAILEAALRGRGAKDALALQERALDHQIDMDEKMRQDDQRQKILDDIARRTLIADQRIARAQGRLAQAEQRMAPDPVKARINMIRGIAEGISRGHSGDMLTGGGYGDPWFEGTAQLAGLGVNAGGGVTGGSMPGGANDQAAEKLALEKQALEGRMDLEREALSTDREERKAARRAEHLKRIAERELLLQGGGAGSNDGTFEM